MISLKCDARMNVYNINNEYVGFQYRGTPGTYYVKGPCDIPCEIVKSHSVFVHCVLFMQIKKGEAI